MARLDRFIQVLYDQSADSLTLVAGEPAALLIDGAHKPITRDPLTVAQILGLLKEIAPPEVGQRISPSSEASFEYRGPPGLVSVDLRPGRNGCTAILRRETAAAGAASRGADVSGSRAEVDRLLRLLVESGGSDLHLRTGEPPILRVSGHLERQEEAPIEAAKLEAMLLGIMPEEDRGKYLDTGDVDWAYELPGVARFRANAGRERRGPLAVFRVIPAKILTCQELAVSKEVQALCGLTKGLVVVTGPTGSGKSTTLAALVDHMNKTRPDHILTIEDPIEFVHQSKSCLVTQRQVGPHTKSFKAALRAALREDPDIVLVGEMRDLETVSIAIETAETGHLVFGTLHTTTAASTIDRIIDQFSADRQAQVRVMLSESLRGVVAQVLCRKIGGGRVAAREILLTTPAISNLIREGKTFQIPSIMQTNRRLGMVTLNDALMELVDAKLVEPGEAYAKAAEKASFAAALKAKRHDTSFLAEA